MAYEPTHQRRYRSMQPNHRIRTNLIQWRALALTALTVLLLLFSGIKTALAAISFQSATTAQNGDSISLIINKPTDVVAGDFLLAQITFNNGSAATITTTPSGWTLVRRTDNGSDIGQAIFYKVATGSEA